MAYRGDLRHSYIFLSIILISLLFFPIQFGTASAEQPGALYGTITDYETTQPVPSVTLKIYQNDTLVKQTASNQTGWYRFAELVPGNYSLQILKDGEVLFTDEVTIVANKTTKLNYPIQLPEKAKGLPPFGQGLVLELINQYAFVFFILFFGLLLLILIPVTVKYLSKKPSKLDIKLAELEREREKLQLLSKRMLIDNLKESAIIPTDNEREKLDGISIDSSILTRKISYQMNEIDARTKRLELGTDTAKLFETLTEVKKHEQKLFGKNL